MRFKKNQLVLTSITHILLRSGKLARDDLERMEDLLKSNTIAHIDEFLKLVDAFAKEIRTFQDTVLREDYKEQRSVYHFIESALKTRCLEAFDTQNKTALKKMLEEVFKRETDELITKARRVQKGKRIGSVFKSITFRKIFKNEKHSIHKLEELKIQEKNIVASIEGLLSQNAPAEKVLEVFRTYANVINEEFHQYFLLEEDVLLDERLLSKMIEELRTLGETRKEKLLKEKIEKASRQFLQLTQETTALLRKSKRISLIRAIITLLLSFTLSPTFAETNKNIETVVSVTENKTEVRKLLEQLIARGSPVNSRTEEGTKYKITIRGRITYKLTILMKNNKIIETKLTLSGKETSSYTFYGSNGFMPVGDNELDTRNRATTTGYGGFSEYSDIHDAKITQQRLLEDLQNMSQQLPRRSIY